MAVLVTLSVFIVSPLFRTVLFGLLLTKASSCRVYRAADGFARD
jgi:hypothetical protein